MSWGGYEEEREKERESRIIIKKQREQITTRGHRQDRVWAERERELCRKWG